MGAPSSKRCPRCCGTGEIAPKAKRARVALPFGPRETRQQSKAAKKAEHNARTAEIRAACLKRSDGKCEHCSLSYVPLDMDHFLGGSQRRSRQSVASCWMLCGGRGGCHANKTRNTPSVAYWNAAFRRHAIRHDYPILAHLEKRPIARAQ